MISTFFQSRKIIYFVFFLSFFLRNFCKFSYEIVFYITRSGWATFDIMWLFSQERAVYIIWVRFVCTRRSRGYTNLTNIIYTALSRLNNHIISKERMKLLVMYIFLFALNYGVPIHPTRYNFTSAYILCHICCILITCLYYIRNRFTDQAWEPKNRLDVGCHIFQLFTKKVCVLGIYDVLQKWCVHVVEARLLCPSIEIFWFDGIIRYQPKNGWETHIFSRFSADKE